VYKRILVPLDGSELAERALAHAVCVARCVKSALDLVRVVPMAPHSVDAAGAVSDMEPEVDEAEEYLAGIAGRLRDEDLKVNTEVRRGDVAEELLEHAAACGCDLIVMSTHGRSGIARWVYGSIADRVLRYGLHTVPAILIVSSAAGAAE
jgi:nucleotide-binding universal stress UspA family protein